MNVDLAISNVSIIDPLNKNITSNQTILIKDGHILDLISSKYKVSGIPDSVVIDGTGKYLISGFWNMHTHLCWKDNLDETLFPTLLSYGITGVRDMGGDINIMNKFKSRIHETPEIGPIIYGAGPIIDGEHPIYPDFSVALTNDNFIEILDSLRKAKVDFLKVYSLLPEELIEKVSVYAKRNNIPFAGHVSEYISPITAAKLGQKSFEHLNRIEDIAEDTSVLNQFANLLIENQSWLCPTLIIYQKKVELSEGKDLYHPLYEQVDDFLKQEWELAKKKRKIPESEPKKLRQVKVKFLAQKQLVKWFYNKGTPMLIGSDFAGMAYIYPGLSLHEEMALLSGLGINNYDILKMATYNPSVFFNISTTHGTIEKGKVADLVLLEANPIDNIRNTMKITQVIRAGKKIN